MDNESIYNSSTITENVVTSDVLAKLRRLKIQESIITASLEKCYSDQNDHTTDSNHYLKWKTYFTKVRNSIHEIKTMFEDIKFATSDTEDNLKNINIEEIKKDILSLNGKLKSVEDFIHTELKSLKSEEKELLKQMNEESKPKINTKRKVKIQNKQYNEVVPSPIRLLINSPLKSKEVQQFQEFMSKNKNRYGGWNEYNHNIFVQIWNKFYAAYDIESVKNNMKDISTIKLSSQFKEEVYRKIPGIKLDEILLHSKWYSEFCYLKRAQQAALEKWRNNKRKIKGRQGKVKDNKSIHQNSNNKNLCKTQSQTNEYQKNVLNGLLQDHDLNQKPKRRNQNSVEDFNTTSENSLRIDNEIPKTTTETREQIIPKFNSSTFATPTEQWINRCNDSGAHGALRYADSNIENVDKLCIPYWRLSLHT